MKIAVFGGTGKAGRFLVDQALAAGHELTVLARDPTKIRIQHDRLAVVTGDVRDPSAVERTVVGCHAVLNLLGPQRGAADPTYMQTLAHNILSAMQAHDIQRLITVTGAVAKHPSDPFSLFRKLVETLMSLLIHRTYQDTGRYAQRIIDSDREWTLVRVPFLTLGPRTGIYRADYGKIGPTSKVSCADLADFMLRALAEHTFVREAPILRY